MMRREQLRHCFLCGALLRLVEAAYKYFIQGISKSFHSLEDIASISFRKEKKKTLLPGSDLFKHRKGAPAKQVA